MHAIWGDVNNDGLLDLYVVKWGARNTLYLNRGDGTFTDVSHEAGVDYWGYGKASQPMLPMIGIPTTAGTGSEAQSFALISDAETHVKMACGDRKAAFQIAILDPEVTVSQSPRVTAVTGIDALSHALESYVTNNRTPVAQMFAREAWIMLEENLERVLHQPGDMEARGAMQMGAFLAGTATSATPSACARWPTGSTPTWKSPPGQRRTRPPTH